MIDAILIEKPGDQQTVKLTTLEDNMLPEGDVRIDIAWSSLNYKDALAITGAGPVVRSFPMVPGIDFSGIVTESAHPDFKPGDKVILNGWGVGEKHWGGLASQARVNGDWLVPLPKQLNRRQAMAIGTAGYTAMLCVLALEKQGIAPDAGEVVVTGAAGGVGSVAVSLLANRGYAVAAVTGRTEEAPYLKSLGASTIIDRAELSAPGKPLARERWAGAVDVAGSTVLANVLAAMKYRGVVTACGLAAGMDLPASVAPFILRGVTLVGIDSVMCPKPLRLAAWQQLAAELDLKQLDAITTEIPLDQVIATAPEFLKGQIRGRIVVPIAPSKA